MSTLASQISALPRLHISRATFDRLAEYSCTNPTGTYIGKLWRREVARGRFVLCGYVTSDDPGFVDVRIWKPFFSIRSEPRALAMMAECVKGGGHLVDDPWNPIT